MQVNRAERRFVSWTLGCVGIGLAVAGLPFFLGENVAIAGAFIIWGWVVWVLYWRAQDRKASRGADPTQP